jgi:glyoxylase-like metal-dependent hydrolase (beta-lactamase superfamily II)
MNSEESTMQNDSRLEMLSLTATIMGQPQTIHPTIIWDDEQTILVDTGFPGQYPLIREELERYGRSILSVSQIIITHQDIDHIGSLPELVNLATGQVQVLSSELEQPYIAGEKQLIKISTEAIAKAMEALPSNVTAEWRQAFKHSLENPPRASVDRVLSAYEELSYCGGIVVIPTPGHTPGHISLYHRPSQTLIAADALTVVDGKLQGPSPQSTLDLKLAMRSLSSLLEYPIRTIICYHGGKYEDNCNHTLAELIEGDTL